MTVYIEKETDVSFLEVYERIMVTVLISSVTLSLATVLFCCLRTS